MTITPPPDDTELPPDPEVPPEFPTSEDPMRAPGEDLTRPPLRMPSDNPDVETEL